MKGQNLHIAPSFSSSFEAWELPLHYATTKEHCTASLSFSSAEIANILPSLPKYLAGDAVCTHQVGRNMLIKSDNMHESEKK